VDKTSVFGLSFDGVEEETSGNFGWRKHVYDHKSFLSNVNFNLFVQILKIKEEENTNICRISSFSSSIPLIRGGGESQFSLIGGGEYQFSIRASMQHSTCG